MTAATDGTPRDEDETATASSDAGTSEATAGGDAPATVQPAAGGATGTGEGTPSAGGVRRLTDADATGRGLRRRAPAGDEGELPESRPLWQNGAIVVGAFAVATGIAEVAGATNLGTALSFGQIGFAIALVFVLVKR